MFYYHVWVRSAQYHGYRPLTYKLNQLLPIGAVVEVPLRKQNVVGIVVQKVAQPAFATKSIGTVFELPPIPKTSLRLGEWVQRFYCAPVGAIAQQFVPTRLTKSLTAQRPALSLPQLKSLATEPPLTDEQKATLEKIRQADTYLIHGRTGSGKTRIYLELAKRSLDQGQSVLVLTPEIGLTSQIAGQFRKAFGNRVVILHSSLSPRKHFETWALILEAPLPLVVVGARSALFSPIANLGLIVVDEAHDTAYKQGQQPYYHAIRVASQLRRLHEATLILGSATPAVNDYYLASTKKKPILRLKQTAVTRPTQQSIRVIDLRNHSLLARSPHLSQPLIDAVAQSLERGEQSLLYLNRRGTARITLCQQCGWQAGCPHCDLPLTYHGDHHLIRCHVCGYRCPPPPACPKCNNTSLVLQSFGTKAIVEEAQNIFPEARILRIDTDSLKSERLENQYERILNGEVDILVGTQLLAKGLDLPRLSTLGIIAAESSLYIPDFTAQERTYQLLTQVLGRVGRGHVDSQAIIQTYNPDSAVLSTALSDDWPTFYSNELAERRRYGFPPFCHMLKLTCRRASSVNAEKAAHSYKARLEAQHSRLRIEGPAPSFHEKVGKQYQWQLTVKTSDREELLAIIPELARGGWQYDIDPVDLL